MQLLWTCQIGWNAARLFSKISWHIQVFASKTSDPKVCSLHHTVSILTLIENTAMPLFRGELAVYLYNDIHLPTLLIN